MFIRYIVCQNFPKQNDEWKCKTIDKSLQWGEAIKNGHTSIKSEGY